MATAGVGRGLSVPSAWRWWRTFPGAWSRESNAKSTKSSLDAPGGMLASVTGRAGGARSRSVSVAPAYETMTCDGSAASRT
jgi:hypothetical protein